MFIVFHYLGEWQACPPQSLGQHFSPELPQSLSVKQLSSHVGLNSEIYLDTFVFIYS